MQLFEWRGVPVVLHWTVLLGLPWLYFRHRDVVEMIIAFLAFFLLLLVHELGHAAVALWRKVPVLEIRLLFLHGFCRHEEPDRQSDAVWIAWGGVAAQAVLLVVAYGAMRLLMSLAFEFYLPLEPLFRIFTLTNAFIIVFNLVPLPSFDGATAWRALPMLWARLPKPDARRWLRERKLQRQSKLVADDIIERLKKKP